MWETPEAVRGAPSGAVSLSRLLARWLPGCGRPRLPLLSDGHWPSERCQAGLSHVPCHLTHPVNAVTILLVHSSAS